MKKGLEKRISYHKPKCHYRNMDCSGGSKKKKLGPMVVKSSYPIFLQELIGVMNKKKLSSQYHLTQKHLKDLINLGEDGFERLMEEFGNDNRSQLLKTMSNYFLRGYRSKNFDSNFKGIFEREARANKYSILQ